MKRLAFLFAALAGMLCVAAAPAFDWRLPAEHPAPFVPEDNPMTPAKVELGRMLFYETALSRDGTMSCASCHAQKRGFTDGQATHTGFHGQPGKRNVMGLTNIGYVKPLTWADPKLATLEAQALNPIFGAAPVEMGMAGREPLLLSRLATSDCYRRQFATAFPETKGEVTMAAVAKAVAAFQRTLISFDSPYDRWLRGDEKAISEAAWRGSYAFEQHHCHDCHSGRNFSNSLFHDIGLPPSARDAGVSEKTGNVRDDNLFRTTTLRNIAVTGPFMHDGSVATLAGTIRARTRDIGGRRVTPPGARDTADIVAFMEALTDEGFLKNPSYSRPKAMCVAKV